MEGTDAMSSLPEQSMEYAEDQPEATLIRTESLRHPDDRAGGGQVALPALPVRRDSNGSAVASEPFGTLIQRCALTEEMANARPANPAAGISMTFDSDLGVHR